MMFLRFARDADGRDVVGTLEWHKGEWPPPERLVDDFGMVGPEGDVWVRVSYSKLPADLPHVARGALYVPSAVAQAMEGEEGNDG